MCAMGNIPTTALRAKRAKNSLDVQELFHPKPMNSSQWFAFGILGATMIMFIWGRLRYDRVAILALLVSLAAGTVPAKKAFSGFSDDIVIIVASALVVSGAIARSGIIESGVRFISPHVRQVRWQLTVLVGSVTFLSAFVAGG